LRQSLQTGEFGEASPHVILPTALPDELHEGNRRASGPIAQLVEQLTFNQ
jgi:hypothetical protein